MNKGLILHRYLTSLGEKGQPTTMRVPTRVWAAPLLAVLLAILLNGVSAAPIAAALVFLNGQDEPLKAIIDEENEFQLVVRVLQPAKNEDWRLVKRIIRRSEVNQIVPTVSKDRLTELRPDRAEMYRDYAEELAAKKQDPEARETGLRLYLIAAYLKPKELGRSSLLGMVGLARSPQEERMFRAMAYLLDPAHDRSLLKTSAARTLAKNNAASHSKVGAAPRARHASGERDELLRVLSILRSRKRSQKAILVRASDMDQLKELLAPFFAILSWEDFQQAADASPPLAPKLLAKIATVELALRGGPPTAPTNGSENRSKMPVAPKGATPWSQLIESRRLSPARPLSITTITEFDPRQAVYRDGKWQRP